MLSFVVGYFSYIKNIILIRKFRLIKLLIELLKFSTSKKSSIYKFNILVSYLVHAKNLLGLTISALHLT